MTDDARPLTPQEIAKIEAETRKLDAETAKAQAEAVEAEAKAATALISLEKANEARLAEQVDDDHVRLYRFDAPVANDSVKACMKSLSRWSRLDEVEIGSWDGEGDAPTPCAITLEFYSPGGSVVAGMRLFDFISALRRKGHHVTTRAAGYAASMAGILLQAGDERVMDRESWLLIHRGSAGAAGSMAEIEDTMEWFKKIDQRILNIFYDHHKAGAKRPRSKKWLAAQFERKDWWLSSEEALDLGFCDRVEDVTF